jgi:hypothetical protein
MKIKYHGRNQSLLKLVPAKKHIIRTQEQSRSRSDVALSVRWVDDSCLISMAVVLCRHEYTASERQASWWSTNDLNKRKQRVKCTIKEKLQHNRNDDNDSEEEVTSIVTTWGAMQERATYAASINFLSTCSSDVSYITSKEFLIWTNRYQSLRGLEKYVDHYIGFSSKQSSSIDRAYQVRQHFLHMYQKYHHLQQQQQQHHLPQQHQHSRSLPNNSTTKVETVAELHAAACAPSTIMAHFLGVADSHALKIL